MEMTAWHSLRLQEAEPFHTQQDVTKCINFQQCTIERIKPQPPTTTKSKHQTNKKLNLQKQQKCLFLHFLSDWNYTGNTNINTGWTLPNRDSFVIQVSVITTGVTVLQGQADTFNQMVISDDDSPVIG